MYSSPRLALDNNDISYLLSPSKARLLAAESASWKSVDDRLKTLFSPHKVPRFERNESTLTALLELIKANEAADEERRILCEAQREGLRKSGEESRGLDLRERLIADVEANLPASGKTALEDLAAAAVLLASHSITCSTEEMETRIMDLTCESFDAENEVLRLRQTQKAFEREEVVQQETMARFVAETDAEVLGSEETQASTAAMNREIKVVGMKLGEYQERVKGLTGYDVGNVRIEDVIEQEKKTMRLQQGIRRLEERIMDMHGLPPDLDVSRKEVERARNELEEWKKRRDRAFEGLVDEE